MPAPAFLALGDSYTIGEGVPEAGRWPMQLVARLHAVQVDVQAPRIIATTGWTTDELSAAMDAAGLKPGYGLVTLLIGVNNQYRGRSQAEYREQFLALLERAISLAGDARRVVVVSIPDWGVTRFAEGRDRAAIAHEIDAFNAIAHDETHRAFARWVDVTGISRRAGDTEGMLVDDGLHPSAAQYALWTEAILPAAKAAIAEL
ncbi:MAG TPA: SGNH/GDSL hydrolase family protein [Luteibacter sp.]|jgi:lysophospholipase L1-like esterase|uniref:SGNH/GDSL hydrolase family protein n=1 Tax=Luteibacter sp. TaxID=1886636 RepID=UPI002F40EF30